jgi:hypothetical protein
MTEWTEQDDMMAADAATEHAASWGPAGELSVSQR